MNTAARLRRWLVVLAASAVGGILLAPSTRSVVTNQLAMLLVPISWMDQFRGIEDGLTVRHRRTLREVARQHPDDFPVQLAAAEIAPPEAGEADAESAAQRLRATAGTRFASSPSFYAHLLRLACLGNLEFHRSEEQLLYGEPPPRRSPAADAEIVARRLAHFDRDAAEGERLDPDNAYFPLTRTVGLFAAHRDTEALAAIQRAGRKHRWEDYTRHAADGAWRLQRLASGDPGAIRRVAAYAAIPLFHYACLPGVARVATFKAAELERAGRTEEGLAIRRALMRCGSLMRAHAGPTIGALVGSALVTEATTRPGGREVLQRYTGGATEDRYRRQQRDYLAYLRGIGQTKEARWAEREFEAGWRAKQVIQEGIAPSAFGGVPLHALLVWWAVGVIVLSNAVWTLVLGGVAGWMGRGVRNPRALLLPAVGLAAVLAALAWRCHFFERWPAGLDSLSAIWSIVANLTAPGEPVTTAPGMSSQLLLLFATDWGRVLPIILPLSVPLGLLIGLMVAAALRRQPVGRTVLAGLRRAAVPVACGLLLAYACLILGTARQETRVHAGLDRLIQHEGRYTAELVGQPWPDVTR